MVVYAKGGDPYQMDTVAGRLRRYADDLHHALEEAAEAARSIGTGWAGRDQADFAGRVDRELRPAVTACEQRIRALADKLQENANAQRKASGETLTGSAASAVPGKTTYKSPRETRYDDTKKSTTTGTSVYRDPQTGTKETKEHQEVEEETKNGRKQKKTVSDSTTTAGLFGPEKTTTTTTSTTTTKKKDGTTRVTGQSTSKEGSFHWGASDEPTPEKVAEDKAKRDDRPPPPPAKEPNKTLEAIKKNTTVELGKWGGPDQLTVYGDRGETGTDKAGASGEYLTTTTGAKTTLDVKDGALVATTTTTAAATLAKGEVHVKNDWGSAGAQAEAGAKAQADASFSAGKDGLQAKAGAEAEIAARANAQAEAHYGPLGIGADATAEAKVSAKVNASVDIGKDGVHAQGGFEANAIARVEANAHANVSGVDAKVGAYASAGAGIEAKGSMDIGKDGIHLTGKYGTTWGVGGGVQYDVTINPKKMINDLGKLIKW